MFVRAVIQEMEHHVKEASLLIDCEYTVFNNVI